MTEGGGAPAAEIGDGYDESGSGYGGRLDETELGDGAARFRGCDPNEAVRLAVEAGRGETSGVGKFVAEGGRDISGVEDADGSSRKDGVKRSVHGDLHVAITTL